MALFSPSFYGLLSPTAAGVGPRQQWPSGVGVRRNPPCQSLSGARAPLLTLSPCQRAVVTFPSPPSLLATYFSFGFSPSFHLPFFVGFHICFLYCVALLLLSLYLFACLLSYILVSYCLPLAVLFLSFVYFYGSVPVFMLRNAILGTPDRSFRLRSVCKPPFIQGVMIRYID